MQNSMVMFIFFVFDRKYPFWANFAQKVKIISWNWNLVARLIRIWRIQWWCSFFLFLIGNTLFGQIWSKKSNYQLKLKFGSQTNSNMQNSMMLFTFFCFWVEIPFLGKFGSKNQNCHFMLKFGTYTNSNMQNSMVMFILSVFGRIWSKKSKLSIEAEIW